MKKKVVIFFISCPFVTAGAMFHKTKKVTSHIGRAFLPAQPAQPKLTTLPSEIRERLIIEQIPLFINGEREIKNVLKNLTNVFNSHPTFRSLTKDSLFLKELGNIIASRISYWGLTDIDSLKRTLSQRAPRSPLLHILTALEEKKAHIFSLDTDLKSAIRDLDINKAQKILAQGANVNLVIITQSPFAFALEVYVSTQNNPQAYTMVKLLLDHGAQVNQQFTSGPQRDTFTPLLYAVSYSSKPLARLLISYGADVDVHIPDGWGYTSPLKKAIEKYEKGLIKLLLKNGATPTIPIGLVDEEDKRIIDAVKFAEIHTVNPNIPHLIKRIIVRNKHRQ